MPRPIYIALFFCSVVAALASAQTPVEGRIDTDTTWTIAGSPYVLTGDVEVVGGATLTVEAGVSVEGMASARLMIGGVADGDIGTLHIPGEGALRVGFRAHDPDEPWVGIVFRQNASDAVFSASGEFLGGSIIRGAVVQQAKAPINMEGASAYLESVIVYGPQDPTGSGIFAELRVPTVKRVRMRDVEVIGSDGYGLFIIGGAGHILEDCTFDRNGTGAAIQAIARVPPDFPRDRIERCVFVRNGIAAAPSLRGGGVVFLGIGGVDFSECVFAANSAHTNGGGIWGFAAEASFTNCQFSGNYAGEAGGGMDFDADMVIEDCAFTDNRAERSAGGYLGFDSRSLTMRRCEFRENEAGRGGAMSLSFGVANVEHCDFVGNQSTSDGGAVRFFRGESQITFTSNNFINNTTAGAGGAVSLIDSDLHESVTFTGNTLEGNIARLGGAVYTTNIDDDVSTFSFAERDGLINTFRNNTAQLGDNIYHASPVDIDATGVCWGTPLPAAIANRIHDGRDEPGLGIVSFDPVATICDTCRTDLDGDGALTLFDYLAFTGLFGLSDMQADFDGDGALTIFDFLVYQTEFDAGCG
ncbi:MAG: right-handed parallel beta-helix repeat-containing protein [Phycisphaera sp.]|nr:MAG: right-handed parallel beta-helix repeat-containing protein [Phycisphaera sp.]